MLNLDVLSDIFQKIDDPQTVFNFVHCSNSTFRMGQRFSQLKRQQLIQTTIQKVMPIPGYTFTTLVYPSGLSETRNDRNQLYNCGKIKNGHREGLWREWDICGNLIEEAVYKDGVKSGFCKRWDTTDDGKQGMAIRGQFNKGTPQGLWMGKCFLFYFAWFNQGEREWLLIGPIKRLWSYVREFFR